MLTEWRIQRTEKKLVEARRKQTDARYDLEYRMDQDNWVADRFIAVTKECGRLEARIKRLKGKL